MDDRWTVDTPDASQEVYLGRQDGTRAWIRRTGSRNVAYTLRIID